MPKSRMEIVCKFDFSFVFFGTGFCIFKFFYLNKANFKCTLFVIVLLK